MFLDTWCYFQPHTCTTGYKSCLWHSHQPITSLLPPLCPFPSPLNYWGSGPWLSLLNSVITPDNIQIYMDDLTNALETQFFISTFSDLHLHSFSDLGIDISNFSPQLSYFLTTTSYASLPTLMPIFILYLNLQDFQPSEPLFLVSPTSLPHYTLGSMIHHVNHSFTNVNSLSFQSCYRKKYH